MPAGQRRIRWVGLRPPHYCALPRLFRRRRLLIIGCGDIGRRLASLVGKEWLVYGVGRSAETLAQIRTVGAVPLNARAGRRRLQDLADWVVHSAPPPANAEHRAGESSSGVVTGSRSEPIDKITREWTARLLQPPRSVRRRNRASWRLESRPLKPKRLVYLSTTGVYGDRQGRMTFETSAVSPTTDRARRRVDAEQWLRDTCRRSTGLQVTTLRVPGIYAADRLPIGRLQERLPALLPQDDVQTNHIHADDLARMTRIALMRGRSQRRLNVVDDSSLPMGDYLDLVAAWACLPAPPRVDRPTLLACVSPMRASFMSESRRLSNRRMKQELRLPLRYPTVAEFLAVHEPPALTPDTHLRTPVQREAPPQGQQLPPI